MGQRTPEHQDVLRHRVIDAGLVVAALLIGLMVLANPPEGQVISPEARYLDVVAGVLGCLALWWRRRAPVLLTVALSLVGAVCALASIPALIALATVAGQRSGRTTAVLTAVSLLSSTVNHVLTPVATPATLLVVSTLSVHAVAVTWGLLVRSRRQLIASLRERAATAEVEARLRAERSQLEARETLAREMHDVLGHRLSLLSVHAGALTYHRGASEEEAARAAEVIRGNARRALQDLREVIGVLRAPEGDLPLPEIGDVAELIEETRRSGTVVELHDEIGMGDDGDVPATAGRTLYRLVQEGLTNARKHAPGAAVTVRISGTPGDRLSVEVVNERAAAASAGPAPVPSGEGLRGLSERAALVGGRLEHGPTDTGGWRLAMSLPWSM